jgi:hypothetical protein
MTRHKNAERFIKQGNCKGINCDECFAYKRDQFCRLAKIYGECPTTGEHPAAVARFEARLAKWRSKHETT